MTRHTLADFKDNPECTLLARLINCRDLLAIVAFQLGEIGYDGASGLLDAVEERLDEGIEESKDCPSALMPRGV